MPIEGTNWFPRIFFFVYFFLSRISRERSMRSWRDFIENRYNIEGKSRMQGIKVVVVVVVVVWFSFSDRSPPGTFPLPLLSTFLVLLVGNTFQRRVTATIQGIPISLWSRRRWPLFFPMTRCSRRAATAAVPRHVAYERRTKRRREERKRVG